MTEPLGRGLCGSLSTRVDHEILELRRENVALRRARYSVGRQLLRATVVGRTVVEFLFLYCVVLTVVLLGEWTVSRYIPCRIPRYSDTFEPGFLKDLGSYFIAGQIGVLAIVSVAVAVVTLLSERADGASVNTDIRLYYVESYSYELSISGVALLLVITFQLFWPLHHVLNVIGIACGDDWFKLALSAIHALWFGVNLLLFLQFITTTLRFVEPSTREGLRERYSANEVIPRDAKARLLRFLFFNAPAHLFGSEDLKEGPGITFGYGSSRSDGAMAELTTTFRAPTRLVDVRLRPLRWALSRWQKRLRQRPKSRAQFGQSLWDGHLTVTPNFDSVLDGQCDLVLRRGDVALTGLEKWVIRRCFRFAPVSSRVDDMPTPDNFLERLVDKLVRQIEQTTATGFRAALDEVIRYHRFILATQNTKDAAGNAFNLAEVGGYISRPDADWVRQYRRAFSAAVDKIGSDTFFVDRLSNLTSRLVPEDGLNVSQRVLQTLLELGIHEVVSLEDWVTRRAVIGTAVEPGTSPGLAGSDKRAYENVLIGFVGGWETLAQTLISSLALSRRPSTADVAAQWDAFCKGFPVFQTHLHFAAYFLAAAVWNNDALGADRLRDLLLRWLQPFYANLQASYMFGNTLLLTPDLTTRDWPTVHAEVAARMRFRQEAALPGPVSGLLLWELHCDVVCVSGLVALHWYASGQQPSNTAAEAAILTLRREKRPGDGSDLTSTTPKSVFRLLFDFVIRYALNPRFAEGRHSANIDGLIRLLTNLASPRMVSGRIYGAYGIEGVETLRTVLLAAMAANLPIRNDEGVAKLLDDLRTDPLFAADESVRNFIWTMQQMVQNLDQAQGNEIYAKAAHAFTRELDLAAATTRLRIVLASAVTVFETLRTERIRNAPLDESRMALVRRRMSEAVSAHGPTITCFRKYAIQKDLSGTTPTIEFVFGVMDKGVFTLPAMSALSSFEDVPTIFTDILRQKLTDVVFAELYHRPKRVVPVDVSESTKLLWQRVTAEASTVGPEPIVLVPFERIGEEISMTVALAVVGDTAAGLNVTRDASIPSGWGSGYLGTIEGIPVYGTQALTKQAILCSGKLLRAIGYGVVHGLDDIADFAFVEGADPEKSQVRLKVAQRIEWADDVFVEFNLRQQDQN
jgi:hypothetical protein